MSDLKQVKEEKPDISDEFIDQFSGTGLNEKKNQKLKHHAVVEGYQLGIFYGYNKQAVDKYPSNIHRCFKTREEAEDSIKDYEKEREEKSKKKFKYEFTIGDVVEIYESWKEAEPHFINRPGLTYRRLEVCEVKKEDGVNDDQDKKPGEPGSINGSPDANVKKTKKPKLKKKKSREEKRSGFYAACNGLMNGVFDDWPLCGYSVVGYPKNIFKKFKTREEAEDSIKDYEKEREEKSKKKFKYEFTIGDVIEIYESWKEAEPHFINRPGLTYRRLEVCEVKKEEDEKDTVQ